MYELKQITNNSYYIESPAKIGVVKIGDEEVCLIDSGNDKDTGRKVRQILDSNGWKLKAIYNTHSNADHIGGNDYLQRQTGCKIYAKGIERDFTNHPILEPSFLYGGYPPKELRHKFLLAAKSEAEELTKEVLPSGFEIIDLNGHFFDMVGYKTPDNVAYIADCLSSKATLDKYQIGFVYDVAQYLNTLSMVKQIKADIFVPAHAEVTSDITSLVDYNVSKVYEIADKILSIIETPMIFENLLSKLFKSFDLTMNFEQYVLIGSAVRSYLSWLCDSQKITAYFENNQLFWAKI